MKTLFIILLGLLICKNTFSQLNYVDRVYQGMGGVEGIYRPNNIILSPDERHLYVVGDKKSIALFKIDSLTSDLEFIECITESHSSILGLTGIYDLDFSSDGKYAYGIIMNNHSIIVFERDSVSGSISPIQSISNQDADSSLTSACAIHVASDGKSVYTATEVANRIGIFQRDTISGLLSFTECQETFVEGHAMDNMSYGFFVKTSKDGKNLYLGSHWDETIIVYKRDKTTGQLSFEQKLVDGTNSIELFHPKSIVISEDDRYLYAIYKYGINIFERDITNGTLQSISYYEILDFPRSFAGDIWPSDGDLANSNTLLISVNYDDAIFKFIVDSTTGLIEADTALHDDKNRITNADNYSGNRNIVIRKDSKVSYVFSYFENSITIIDNNIDSSGMSARKEIVYGDGGIEYMNELRSLGITDNSKYLFASSYYDNAVLSFERIDSTGTLLHIDTAFAGTYYTSSSEGITKICLSKDQKNLYACTYNWHIDAEDNGVFVFSIDTSNGDINFLQCIPNSDTDAYGTLSFEDIIASNDNKNVYALSERDIVKIYTRNTSTGELTFKHNITLDPIGSATYFDANKILMSDDSEYVYFVSDYSIKVYSRSLSTGNLNLIQTVPCFEDLQEYDIYFNDAILSEDQESMFLIRSFAPFLVQYRRDSNNGKLFFINKYIDNDSLQSPDRICSSENSKYLYTDGKYSGIGVIRLDPNSGLYEYVKTIDIDQPDEGSIVAVRDLKFTSNHRNLYTISGQSKSIVNLKPYLFLGNDIDACDGDTIIIAHQSDYESYLWSTGETVDCINVSSSGVYSLQATNKFGEEERDTINIIFYESPTVELGEDFTFCGDTCILSPINCSDTIYLWSDGSSEDSVKVTQTGYYSLSVYNSAGCIDIDSVHVTISEEPNLDLGPNIILTTLDTYILDPGIYDSYEWSYGSNNSLEQIISINQSHFSNSDSLHVLLRVENNGCFSEDSLFIIFNNSTSYEHIIKSSFKIYPNPVIESLNVKLYNVQNQINCYSINIYTESGNKIHTIKECSNIINIDFGNFSSGTYIIEIKGANIQLTKKIIKIK